MRGNRRVISAALATAGVCSALALAGRRGAAATATAPATAAAPAGRGRGRAPGGGRAGRHRAGHHLPQEPATGAADPSARPGALRQIRAAQAPYLARLARLGATGVHGYRLVDAIAARVPASALAGLAASPGVASVIPDSPSAGPGGRARRAPATPSTARLPPATVPQATVMTTPPGACSASPQLEPEGLALTGTAARRQARRPRGRSATPGRA